MAVAEHNRILTLAARAALGPLGLRQKGGSRTWLDDHGWWVGVVEFQPSAWAKGSYLNVAACWLWSGKDYLSFDYAPSGSQSRIGGFEKFQTTEQFAVAAAHLAQEAHAALVTLRSEITSIRTAAVALQSRKPRSIWDNYHAGVASGLVGDAGTARRYFDEVMADKFDFDWVIELKRKVDTLRAAVDVRTAFVSEVQSLVRHARLGLRLEEVDLAAVGV